MNRDLEDLQWITLGLIGVLVVLCGLLLLVVWLAMNFIQITKRLRVMLCRFTTEARRHGDLERADDDRGPPALSKQSVPEGESGTDPFRNGRGGTSPRPVGQSTGTGSSPSVPPCLRGELQVDDTVEYAALFRHQLEPGKQAEVTEDLCWVMGSGFRLPVGSRVQLIRRYGTTTGGERWTGMHEGHFFSSIPAEALKPVAP